MSNNYSHVAFFIANIKAIYLTFVDDKIIMAYILENQLIDLPFCMKMKLKVNL